MLGFQTYVFPNISGFLKYEFGLGAGPDPRKNEILGCQGGHLRQFHSKILAYSLFFKRLLFTSLTYSGAIIWNSIPLEIKNSSSLNIFVNKCKAWMKRGE